jgi:hypothetical protein
VNHKQPTTVTKKEYWTTLVSITLLLIFIAVVVSLTLYRSGPPDKEIIIFPKSTYICTTEFHDGVQEKICAFKGESLVDPNTQQQ